MSKKKEKKLCKCMKVSLNMMVKATDLFVKNMNQLSYHDLPSSIMAFGIPMVHHISALPQNFTTSHMQNSAKYKDRYMDELVTSTSARNKSDSRRREEDKKEETYSKTKGHEEGDSEEDKKEDLFEINLEAATSLSLTKKGGNVLLANCLLPAAKISGAVPVKTMKLEEAKLHGAGNFLTTKRENDYFGFDWYCQMNSGIKE